MADELLGVHILDARTVSVERGEYRHLDDALALLIPTVEVADEVDVLDVKLLYGRNLALLQQVKLTLERTPAASAFAGN